MVVPSEIYWKVFTLTGSVMAYMLYKRSLLQ